MLDERVGKRLPRSWFQRLASRLLEANGLRTEDEWPVRDRQNRLVAELDLAIVEHLVRLECQSWEWHGSPAAQRQDSLRKRRLRRMGWAIIELWWSDLDRIDDVVGDVLDAIDRARPLQRAPDAPSARQIIPARE